MLTPAPCPFYHIETYVIAQDLAKNIGWSASTLTLYNVTNMTEKLPHYLFTTRAFRVTASPLALQAGTLTAEGWLHSRPSC